MMDPDGDPTGAMLAKQEETVAGMVNLQRTATSKARDVLTARLYWWARGARSQKHVGLELRREPKGVQQSEPGLVVFPAST